MALRSHLGLCLALLLGLACKKESADAPHLATPAPDPAAAIPAAAEPAPAAKTPAESVPAATARAPEAKPAAHPPPSAASAKPATAAKDERKTAAAKPGGGTKKHLTADDLNRMHAPAPPPPNTPAPAPEPAAAAAAAEPSPVAAEPIAKPATKVVIPNTSRVRVDVPSGLQAWLDKDTRMQPWLGKVMKVIDGCYGDVLASNPNASGTISFQVTMHQNARPDPDIQSLPGALSGVVACATGQLMRTRMPLFTGNEGERYVVKVRFGS